MKEVKSVCPYCGVGCGVILQVEAGQVTKVQGDKQHPSNSGRLCTKGLTCHQALKESGRLESALMRQDRQQPHTAVDINLAIANTAAGLRAHLEKDGPDSIALYVSGQMSLEAQYLANKLAKGFIGTNNIESNSRLCMASAATGYKQSLGADGPPGAYDDFDHADLFFIIGANMADCHPILFLRMMDRVKAGAKLIVVDPRRTATAEKANLFLPIRAGSDLSLLNGLLLWLMQRNALDPAFIASHTEGWDAMPAFLADYTLEKVSARTGLSEASIAQAADWIAQAPNWMSCWTMGLNQSSHGTGNTNALCNLHLATGAIGKRGSGPFSLTGQPNAMGGREMGYMGLGLPGQRSVLNAHDRKFTEDIWGIPTGSLRTESLGGTVEMFNQMRQGRIKACWIICTNPVASVPNRQQAIEGLQKAELVISQDAFLATETHPYADILLPAALWAEAEGVMVNSERNLTLMQKATEPPADALPDWQIIAKVACAMGYGDAFGYASAEEVFEEIKQFGNPATGYDLQGISYARLRQTPVQWPSSQNDSPARNPIRYLAATAPTSATETPHRPEEPRLRFPTASGRAQFIPRPDRLPAELPCADYPFILNTGRVQHQWHTLTKTGKIATLNKLNPGPFIEIHPQDAAALQLNSKDPVQVRSRRGQALLPACITDRVLPGHCFVPFHWNDLYGELLAINALTNDAVDPFSEQPEFKFCAVALAKSAQESKTPSSALPPVETGSEEAETLAALLGLGASPSLSLDAAESRYMQGFVSALRALAGTQRHACPILPSLAPITADNRLAINGILAGLFSRTDDLHAHAVPQNSAPDAPSSAAVDHPSAQNAILVLWASSTGNAQALAHECAQTLEGQGHRVSVQAMEQVGADILQSTLQALFITSTFGDGDPPDNGQSFWRDLCQEPARQLPQLRYAVLALGDSSYREFCGFGRKLDAHLAQSGALALTPRIDCDTDYRASAQSWFATVGAQLKALADSPSPASPKPSPPPSQSTTPTAPALQAPQAYTRQHPLSAHLIGNYLLSKPGARKEMRQLIFDLGGHDFAYAPGDALGVWPQNAPATVTALLAQLHLQPDARVRLGDTEETSLLEALTHHTELSRVSPKLMAWAAQNPHRTAAPTPGNHTSPQDLAQWAQGKDVLAFVTEFAPPFTAQTLVDHLRPMQPRLYSISSSPSVFPHQVHITPSTIRRRGSDHPAGLCSSFLADAQPAQTVRIFLKKTPTFHLPMDHGSPIIMIGAGSGIAPFRAFLQERQAQKALGLNWLFFGENNQATDFYYEGELLEMQEKGCLHQLTTAFSRDQAHKIYVQHRMREQGEKLWQWLRAGAYVYVCGDAKTLAKGVDTALLEIIQTHGNMDTEKSKLWLLELIKWKRYLRDVY